MEPRTPEEFAVGEVAIINRPTSPNHGKEVTIIGPLQLMRARNTQTGEVFEGLHYQIDASGLEFGPHYNPSGRCWAEPRHLRKKRPPAKDRDVVRWADCPWQPEVLRV